MMSTAVYFLTLGLASGVTGLWGRRILGDMGLVQGFEAGLYAWAFIALLYIITQSSFRAALLIYKPTRAVSLSITEVLSQCAALLLIPSLLGVTLPLPYAALQRVEPFIHLGAFLGFHGLFKMMAFFAGVQGAPESRVRAFPWLGGTLVAAVAAFVVATGYLNLVQEERPVLNGETTPFAVDNNYAVARTAPENTRIITTVQGEHGDFVSFLVAPHPDEIAFPETVYFSVSAVGEEQSLESWKGTARKRVLHAVPHAWTELRFARSDFPEDSETFSLYWSVEEPESLKQRLGLQPPVSSGRRMLVSGPWRHTKTGRNTAPGIVIIVAEGLGAENMSLHGYTRTTTPELMGRAPDMLLFNESYTPTPETTAACMSLLTGLNPLAHGYFESHAGPMPPEVKSIVEIARNQGYFTVAFTEGRGLDGTDLIYGSDFDRGFMLFDDYFPIEVHRTGTGSATEPQLPRPAGAHVTLEKASGWIAAHEDAQYLVFVRLRELRTPQRRARYGQGFLGRGRTPTPMDIYDTAITYMDRQLNLFLEQMHALPHEHQPVVLITSTHGYDFTEPGRGAWRRGGPGKRSLHESALRIPLLLDVPGRKGLVHNTPVSLVDVAPTLAALAGLTIPHQHEGVNLVNDPHIRGCISLRGDPVALSIRSGRWRFTWQSGQSPYTGAQLEAPFIIEFIDILRHRNGLAPENNIRNEARLVENFERQLRTFLQAYQNADH